MRWALFGAIVIGLGCNDQGLPFPADTARRPLDATIVWPDESVPDADVPGDLLPCPGGPDLPLIPPPSPLPFDAPAFYLANAKPRSLVAGDVNGDGYPDLVAPDLLTVLPGRKGGGFGAPIDSANTFFGYDGTLADFDGDGKLDVVTAESDPNWKYYIALYHGHGDGTFAAWNRFEVPSAGASRFVIADFDGDGKRDLAWGAGALRVRLGNGDGSFRVPAGAAPTDLFLTVAAADLDGDGRADLAGVPDNQRRAAVYRGRGDGSFDAPALYGARGANWGVMSVAIADLDGDGKLDLISGVVLGELAVLPGRGDGTFDSPMVVPTLDTAGEIVVADIDGDGKRDVVVMGDGRFGIDLAFHRGLGGFALGPPSLRVAGDYPRDLAAADFDGDGRADIAVLASMGVAILPGAVGAAPRTTRDEAAEHDPNGTVLADFNGDGALDLVITAAGTLDANNMTIGRGTFFHRGRGDGSFEAGRAIDLRSAGDLIARDLDGDGRLDLAMAANDGVVVLRGNGDGTFRAGLRTLTGDPVNNLATGDLDEDGIPDLVATGYRTNDVALLRGRGDGLFDATAWPGAGDPWTLAVGDFDGDRHADVAAGAGGYHSQTGSLVVFRGDGRGMLAPPEVVLSDTSVLALAAADLDGDRLDELIVMKNGFSLDLDVTRRSCDGSWSAASVATLKRGARSLAVADIDGDARLDLLVPQPDIPCIDRCLTSGLAVLLSRGGATFAEPTYYPTGYEPWMATVGDVDGDGRPDAVVANTGGTVTVLRNLKP